MVGDKPNIEHKDILIDENIIERIEDKIDLSNDIDIKRICF